MCLCDKVSCGQSVHTYSSGILSEAKITGRTNLTFDPISVGREQNKNSAKSKCRSKCGSRILGPVHTGRVSRYARKFACKSFDVAFNCL